MKNGERNTLRIHLIASYDSSDVLLHAYLFATMDFAFYFLLAKEQH